MKNCKKILIVSLMMNIIMLHACEQGETKSQDVALSIITNFTHLNVAPAKKRAREYISDTSSDTLSASEDESVDSLIYSPSPTNVAIFRQPSKIPALDMSLVAQYNPKNYPHHKRQRHDSPSFDDEFTVKAAQVFWREEK